MKAQEAPALLNAWNGNDGEILRAIEVFFKVPGRKK